MLVLTFTLTLTSEITVYRLTQLMLDMMQE